MNDIRRHNQDKTTLGGDLLCLCSYVWSWATSSVNDTLVSQKHTGLLRNCSKEKQAWKAPAQEWMIRLFYCRYHRSPWEMGCHTWERSGSHDCTFDL